MPADRRLTTLLPLVAALVLGAFLLVKLALPAPNGKRQTARAEASLRVRATKLGRILVDAQNRTLYLYATDRRGRSRCYGECARIWPPALVSGKPRAEAQLIAAKLTILRRRDSRRQLVYNGHPLYTVIADTRPGQVNGQGWGGVWFVLSPAGRQIGKADESDGY